MNHLRRMRDSLCRDLRAPKHKAAFKAARARSPELEPYPDIGAVLDALSSKENESYRVREPLLRALFIQHKAYACTNTWSSLLYVAFYPMLGHLRYLLTTDNMCHDDLDQLVMTSFLESLAELPLELVEDRLPMRLRQRTRRKVFDTLKDEDAYQSRLQELGRLAELWVAFDPFTESETSESNLELDEMEAMLRHLGEGAVGKRDLDIVASTILRREPLRHYVFRTCQFSSKKGYLRHYERVKRRRCRAMARLRAHTLESLTCPGISRSLLYLFEREFSEVPETAPRHGSEEVMR